VGGGGSATSVDTELLENRRADPTGTSAAPGDDREARRHEGKEGGGGLARHQRRQWGRGRRVDDG
jgi:hypothetical protein